MVHPTPSTRIARRAPAKRNARELPSERAPLRPTSRSIAALREEAQHCRACPLYRNATQVVFGEGRVSSRIVLIGEQPGDREDLAGKPFVGPAGKLLDRALEQAGVERAATYVTNAVKHFKFEPRGKRRIHKKPNEQELSACRHQWLDRELRLIEPELIVAMGATAARAVFGRVTAIGKNRGHVIKDATLVNDITADVIVTVHPSFLLRVPDEDRDAAFEAFVADLKLARKYAPS